MTSRGIGVTSGPPALVQIRKSPLLAGDFTYHPLRHVRGRVGCRGPDASHYPRRIMAGTTRKTPRHRKARTSSASAGAGGARLPMLRTSERSALKKCEWLWDITYNRRLRGRAAPALQFGTLVHAALARYYIPGPKRGEHPARVFEELYERDLR